jgi:TonB-linked SusC/RagA family outer membrane protein
MQLIAFCKANAMRRFLPTTKTLLVMKLTILFLLAACLQLYAKSYAQVTLAEKKAPLEKVLKTIKQQSGYTLFYDEQLLKQKGKPVDVNVQNVSVVQALQLVFANQVLTYEITGNTILVKEKEEKKIEVPTPPLPPATIDVKGTVTDEKGIPLNGATITLKGSNKGTATNENGEFVLKGIPEDAVLAINFTGYLKQEIAIKGQQQFAIVLKVDVKSLDDVSVEANTGYQKVKPNEVNGSMVVIDNKTLNEQVGPNILQRLNGVTSGLYFNIGKNKSTGSPNPLSIRGLSTINGPVDPLIILDNFIYEGDINNINPNDVESVTVLKDAAASSIWGARAGNGVIVITTKKGRFNQKLKIDFDSKVTIDEKPDLFSRPQMSINDYVNVEEFLFNKGYFNSQITSTLKQALTPAVEVFLKRRNGLISSSDSAAQINALKAIDSREQYDKYFYTKAILQQHFLSLSGGSGNIAWIISGAYNQSQGMLKEKSDKANIHINNLYRPTKNLQINIGAYYSSTTSVSGIPTGYNQVTINSRIVPYLKFADDNGNAIPIAKIYSEGYTDTVGAGHLLNWKYYPLEDYKHDQTTSSIQLITANLGANYEVLKGLNISVNYQYQRQWSSSERNADIESYYTRDLINRFTKLSRTSAPDTFRIPKGGTLSASSRYLRSQNIRGQVDYKKSWRQNTVSAILGAEIRESISGGGGQYTIYGYQEDPLSIGTVDYYNTYPTIVNGSLASIPGSPIISGTFIDRFVSLYTNLAYTYKQRYTVSASARKDASNVFGQTTNAKWNPLWSAGIGWDISKEHFFHLPWLSYLKLKSTIGYSGNVDISKTPLAVSGSGTNTITNFPTQQIGAPNNPSLRWEKVQQLNIGIDFSTKRQTISGSLEYYVKRGNDLYGETPFDYTTFGFTPTITRNVAAMKGEGIDIAIHTLNMDKRIKWTTSFLFSYNSSKTTAYYTTGAQNIYSVNTGNAIFPIVGKPLYSLAVYKWGGLDNVGDPLGYLNGQLSKDYLSIFDAVNNKGLNGGSVVYVGPANPTHFGSFINSVKWKGLSLSCNITYKFGYYFLKPSLNYSVLYGSGLGHSEFQDRWKQPGDELTTHVPSMAYTNYPQFSSRTSFYSSSEINVLKGDNIRLQYINCSYTIDKANKKFPFNQLQLYINIANLGIIWRANKENIDPDYPSATGFPPVRQFTIGLKGNL